MFREEGLLTEKLIAFFIILCQEPLLYLMLMIKPKKIKPKKEKAYIFPSFQNLMTGPDPVTYNGKKIVNKNHLIED